MSDEQPLSTSAESAGQADHGLAACLRTPGDPGHRFPVRGLSVCPALPGDDDIDIPHCLFKMKQIEHHRDAGRRTLLRAKHGGRSLAAVERIGDITHDPNEHPAILPTRRRESPEPAEQTRALADHWLSAPDPAGNQRQSSSVRRPSAYRETLRTVRAAG